MYNVAGFSEGATNGAIIGGIVGLLMYPVFIVLAKQRQKTGNAMGKPVRRELLWTGRMDEALDRSAKVLRDQKADVINLDRGHGVILAGTGANLRTTGSTVYVYVQAAPGGFRVTVQAAPTMSLKDMGFSQQFVNRFVELWEAQGGPQQPIGASDFVV